MPNFKPINKRLVLTVLSVLGIAISLYLTYTKLTESEIKCGFGGCNVVQKSEYSQVFGIPVAVFGVIFYFLLFALNHLKANKFLKYWVLIGLVFSLYFTYLELFVINAICTWCVASAILIVLATVLVFLDKPTS